MECTFMMKMEITYIHMNLFMEKKKKLLVD